MPQPKSIAAYSDCEEQFERAITSVHGVAVSLDTPGSATQFIQKMNTYRERLRKQSRGIYPPDDPRYGTSPYDQFKLTIDKENPSRVLIKPYRINVLGVEELGPEG